MITNSLKIMLWNREIGRLSWDGKRNISYFEYNKDFLNGNLDVFPLIASIKSPVGRRPIIGDKENKLYRKLPPFLADSLPDAWGNQVFECWRIGKGIRSQDVTPLDVLSFIGKRGMGALEFIPETSGINHSEDVNLKSLTELAQRIFAERENVRILPGESLTMQSLIAVGTSAGGRQPKAVLAINPSTGEIRSGQVGGLKDFEYCILKFGASARSSSELEMAYYDMAVAAGIDMMPCRLLEVEGKQHFVTLRFDRHGECKLHMQTLAALYPEADSYEKLLMVCRKMRLPESAQEEVFRRMVFNILANNTDDHNKNFSFLMNEKGQWRLSPAYDMTYIFNTGGFLPETMHCLMMRGKLSNQTIEDALALAEENGIKKAANVIRQVADAVARFREFATKYKVQERWIGAVETTLNSHLEEWRLNTEKKTYATFAINGVNYTNVRVERAYKGNFHLLATIENRNIKFVIGKNKAEYPLIENTGIANLSLDILQSLVERYMSK